MKSLSATPSKRLKQLERACLKAVLHRYRFWVKENPEGLLPKKHPRSVREPGGWEAINAAKRLYEAINAK